MGVVFLGVAIGLALEHCFLGVAFAKYFDDGFELAPARTEAAPIFLAGAVPVAAVITALYGLAERSARTLLAVISALASLALALELSRGRMFGEPSTRVAAVAVVVVAGALVGGTLPRLVRLPGAALLFGASALGAWCADAFLFHRTYPAFHAALFVISLGSCGFMAAIHERRLVSGWLAGWVLGLFSLFRAPACARALHEHEGLRVALVEHVPWTGRAVRLAMAIDPPPVEDDDTAAPDDAVADTAPAAPVVPPLDFTGRDILLITVDALRADHLGAYGYTRPTSPRFDALAKEGTLFLHAYCPIPHTSHSLVSLMTGKYIHPLLQVGLGGDSTTLAREAGRLGYHTAAFYPPAVWYVDTELFDAFYTRALDFSFHVEAFADPATRTSEVRAHLATQPRDAPVFVWVHLFEPHEPYDRHPDHDFGDEDVDAYDGEIAATDDGIGALVEMMRELRRDPIIIVTSDHGEEFDEHGGQFHGTTTYEEQVRVPLLVIGPGVPAGSRLELAVQTIDLFPTLLGALHTTRPAGVRGRDLGSVLAGKVIDSRGSAWVEADRYEMLADGSLRLVCERTSSGCQLFDVTDDPLEHRDRSRDHRGELKRMRSTLSFVGREQGRLEPKTAKPTP